MCDGIANGYPRAPNLVIPPCPPANVIIASNVLNTDGNVIAGNVISGDGTFTGNLYVSGTIISNITYTSLNVGGAVNAVSFAGQAFYGNGYGLSNLNASNLTGTIQNTNLPVLGTIGTYGDFSNVSRVSIDQYGRVTAASNVAILSSQWTTVAGNIAYRNGVSIGTLSAPPPGSNLYVLGTANFTTLNVTSLFANSATIFGSKTLNVFGVSNLAYVTGDGGGLANVQSAALVGNVANATVALVVSQPSQPNITSVGTLTGLGVSGVLNASLYVGNASGLSNINSSNLVGNVANANVALVVSQPSQPNITSVGTLTALQVSGGVTGGTFYGSGSGLSAVPVANLVGTVNYANTAGAIINPAQTNITSVGTLTTLQVSGGVTGGTFYGSGAGLTNIPISNLTGTVNYANTAGAVINPAQTNITSVGALTTLTVIGSLAAGTLSGDGQGLYGIHASAIVETVATANSVVQPAQTNITSVGTLTGLNVQGLLIASNASGLSNINATNVVMGTLATGVFPLSGATAGMYGSGANVSQVTIDKYGRVTLASNIAIVASQWTTVNGNVAYQNGVSIGTLNAPPTGSNLYVLGTATIGNVSTNGSAISSIQASNIQGNVANANVALVVSQPLQPNITQVGTLTGLYSSGNITASFFTGQGNALSNIQSATLVGNVASANMALVITQNAQPNITSVGTLTSLVVSGVLNASLHVGNASGLSNINSSNLVGNVANANVALVVSQPLQPNITQVGTLTGLYSTGNLTATFFAGGGNALSNIQSATLVGNVANANVALVVSQPLQPNITQVGTLTGLYSSGNITASFFTGGGNALSNIQSSALVGNVANANVALVVSQPAQPNITSVGTLASLNVTGISNVTDITANGFSSNASTTIFNCDTLTIPFVYSTTLNVTTVSNTGTLVALNLYGQGNGLTNVQSSVLMGNVANANVALVVSQPLQPNITQVGTLNGLYSTGNITATFFTGGGNALSNIQSATLVGNVANANVALVVSQPLQPNITQVGTLTGLYSSGNITASFFTGGGNALSNIQSATLVGNVANANVALVVSQPLQPNITQVGTLTGLYSSGNITASFFTGQGNALSNIQSATLVGNVASANMALVVSQNAQPNITSVGTLTSLVVSGVLNASLHVGNASGLSNINSSNLVGNVANANVALVVSQPLQPNITQVGTLTGLYSSGNITASFFTGGGNALSNIQSATLVGNVANANVALVVSQPLQPNITQVGTLTGLYSSGNITATFFTGQGNGLTNVQSSVLVGNVANANVALVVSQPAQPNITSVGLLSNLAVSNSVTVSNLVSSLINVSTTSNLANVVVNDLFVPGSMRSNLTNTTFYFNTLTIPFVNSTTLNVSSTSNLDTLTLTGEPGLSTLYTVGNVYASNALTAPNVFATTANVATLNVATISNLNTLVLTNNLYASNAVTTTNVFATTANVATLNVATVSNLSTLVVTNNLYASNAISTTNVFAITATVPGFTSQFTVNGGGTVTYSAAGYLLWGTRVIVIPVWRNAAYSVGYWDINCPTSGTITYNGTTVTCTAAGIPMNNWVALYYRVVPGTNSTSVQANFILKDNNDSAYSPDSNWILLAVRNGDSTEIKWMPGNTTIPLGGTFYTPSASYDKVQVAGTVVVDSARTGIFNNLYSANALTTTNVISTGQVGIGTATLSSAAALSVYGPSNGIVTTFYDKTGQNMFIATNNGGNGYFFGFSRAGDVLINSSYLPLSIGIQASPNLGIGMRMGGQGGGDGGSVTLYANTQFMAVTNSGVGIGSTNPSANLYVAGNVYVSNALTTGNVFVSNGLNVGSGTLGRNVFVFSNTSGLANVMGMDSNATVVIGLPPSSNVNYGKGYTRTAKAGLIINSGGNFTYPINLSLVGTSGQGNSYNNGIDFGGGGQGCAQIVQLGIGGGNGALGFYFNNSNGADGNIVESMRMSMSGFSILTYATARATLDVGGNIFASNSLQTTNVLTSNINVSYTANVSNLVVTSNILPGPSGNTYLTGNIIVSGNVFTSLGSPLGEGGGFYFSLPSDIALQTPYTGAIYGTTYPMSVGLSNGWTITGTSTVITVTTNGNFKFNKVGVYKLSAVFQGSVDNITGLAVGSNVADVHGTDQGYLYRYTTFVSQNPTELIEIPINVTDSSKYYYLDVWSVSGGAIKATPTGTGGTYLTITPLQGGGLATGGPGGTPGTQWISSGQNIYFPNSVGVGAVNPAYQLDVSGDIRATGNVYSAWPVATGLTTNYAPGPLDYYIGVNGPGVTVTLPLGSGVVKGRTYIIKDEAGKATTAPVNIATSGSDKIDGSSLITLAVNYAALTVLWTGTRWSII